MSTRQSEATTARKSRASTRKSTKSVPFTPAFGSDNYNSTVALAIAAPQFQISRDIAQGRRSRASEAVRRSANNEERESTVMDDDDDHTRSDTQSNVTRTTAATAKTNEQRKSRAHSVKSKKSGKSGKSSEAEKRRAQREEEKKKRTCCQGGPIAFLVEMYYDFKYFLVELIEGYGGKFITLLAIVYFCMKGLSNNAVSAAMLPFYKTTLQIESTEYQKYFNVANMAFSLKPLVGLCSDLLPIGGYSKRYYLAIIAVTSAASLVIIVAWAAGQGSAAAGPTTAALFFVFFMGIAGADLLMEGKYSEMMNNQKASPSVITFVWLLFSVGALAGALLEGPMADMARPEVILMCAAPFAAIPAVFAILGWIPEKRRVGGCCGASSPSEQDAIEDKAGLDDEAFLRGSQQPLSPNHLSPTDSYGGTSYAPVHKEGKLNASSDSSSVIKEETVVTVIDPYADAEVGEEAADEDVEEKPKSWALDTDGPFLRALRTPTGLAVLGAATASCSLIMAVISLLSTNLVLLIFIVPAATFLLVASFLVLPKAAALANLFMFLRELFYMQMTGPLGYFYTAKPACLADGPHFSYTYYQTLTSFLGAAGTMVGTVIFQRYLSKMTFMRVFWVSTSLKIFASGFDLIITKRWNTHYLGISDELMFLCGDAIIYPICTMLDFMPTTVLLSRLCPKGMESTMFSLLASFNNFGQSISSALGYIIAGYLNIQTSDDDCNFNNLWLLVVLGHMLLPSTVYVFSWALMPDTPMTVTIPTEEEEAEAAKTAEEARKEANVIKNFSPKEGAVVIDVSERDAREAVEAEVADEAPQAPTSPTTIIEQENRENTEE